MFESTQEALAYSKTASQDDLAAIAKIRILKIKKAKELQNKDLDAAMKLAVQAQFCRECLDAAGFFYEEEK